MRKQSLCTNGKDEANCCSLTPQVKIQSFIINNEQERKEILRNIQISSQFNMRHRGLFEFYGKDFIAFKSEKPQDKNRNDFLRMISKYMADYPEDSCPTSWKNCQPSFWEELITTTFPHHMKITRQKKEVERFLNQLTIFVCWLDQKGGTSLAPMIENFIKEYYPQLKICEDLLDQLYLKHFPHIHQSDWNPDQDVNNMLRALGQFPNPIHSIFEVKSKMKGTSVLTDLNSDQCYHVKGLPTQLVCTGLLLNGSIGKSHGNRNWQWCLTEGVYPHNAQKYITSL